MNTNISLAWVDLSYTTRSLFLKNDKNILNGLNGAVNFGTITALMGPSGSGKTTLLNCINGKMKFKLQEESQIYLSSSEKIYSCFIAQHENEHLIMGLTVKQNMIYASKLKNSSIKFKVDHEKNVRNLLSEFMISDIMNTRVENCSGGEHKRLSIALEMTTWIKPNLICIDEPTSGLDSNSAETVISIYNLFYKLKKTYLNH
jgi:ABC-type multidrug transport system ATPase subunit